MSRGLKPGLAKAFNSDRKELGLFEESNSDTFHCVLVDMVYKSSPGLITSYNADYVFTFKPLPKIYLGIKNKRHA